MNTVPRCLFTTMVFDPERDPFQQKHYDTFYRCFQSWHRLMPDWDLRIVTLENVFEFGRDEWAEERLAEGNFIALSHWARLQWLFEHGGVYVDLDIEAVQRFDSLCEPGWFFCGHEGGDPYANNAIMGSSPGHAFVARLMDYTKTFPLTHPEFPNETGPRGITKLLIQHGWNRELNALQELNKGKIRVFPSDVFYPYFWTKTFTPECVTDRTVAIHHWASSWVTS